VIVFACMGGYAEVFEVFLAFLEGFFVDVAQFVLGISEIGSDGGEMWWSQFD